MELILEAREAGQHSRNGARLYLADACVEGNYAATDFAAIPLLGKSISLTVDLSAAECGCNAAFYLVSMATQRLPGQCDADRYWCDRLLIEAIPIYSFCESHDMVPYWESS